MEIVVTFPVITKFCPWFMDKTNLWRLSLTYFWTDFTGQ